LFIYNRDSKSVFFPTPRIRPQLNH